MFDELKEKSLRIVTLSFHNYMRQVYYVMVTQKKTAGVKLGSSSLVAIPAIAWATSLNRTTVVRAIAAATATALRSVAAAIANNYVTRNIDQSNGDKAFSDIPDQFRYHLDDWLVLSGETTKYWNSSTSSAMYSPGHRNK